MVNIGPLYDKDGGLPTNYEEAAAWYRKQPTPGMHWQCSTLVGSTMRGAAHQETLLKRRLGIEKAADAGNALAMFNLGRIYDEGRGTSRNAAEAVAWYRKAADAGNAGAMFNLGGMYDTGEGVPENHAEANAWYRKAADAGLVDGMFNLASNYHHGGGVPQDDTEAIAWYRKAVAVGDPRSACNLGLMYAVGAGVPGVALTQPYISARRPKAESGWEWPTLASCMNLVMVCRKTGAPQSLGIARRSRRASSQRSAYSRTR